MTPKRLILLLLLFYSPAHSYAFSGCFFNERSQNTDTLTIFSKILNEDRGIIIYSHADYKKSNTTRMLYFLDGENSGKLISDILKNDKTGELVIAAIINTDRRRDMLAVKGASVFLRCLKEEILPTIEAEFRVKGRILSGHSFSGSFCLFAMLEEPGLFDTYIVSSPTPVMSMTKPDLYTNLDNLLDKEIRLIITWGSKDMNQVKKWGSRLISTLESTRLNKIRWNSKIFNDRNHLNSRTDSINEWGLLSEKEQ